MKQRHPFLTTKELTQVALAAAFLTICAWTAIPLGEVPITLQTFAIFIIAGLFNIKCGMIALTVYLLMGMVGLPVFAGMTGGLGHIIGPTGGYLVGFFLTILIIGTMMKRFGKKLAVLGISAILGMILCYAFGTIWFCTLYTGGINGAGITVALIKCVAPYLIPDILKLIFATWTVKRLTPLLIQS